MVELRVSDGVEGLPAEAGGCRLSALPARPLGVTTRPAEGLRLGIGQWLVAGAGEVDVSDAFVGLAVEGPDAAGVLARLMPIDLAGLPARTLLRHVPVIVSVRAEGFALLVPRSYAASAVGELLTAMRSVAARRASAVDSRGGRR